MYCLWMASDYCRSFYHHQPVFFLQYSISLALCLTRQYRVNTPFIPFQMYSMKWFHPIYKSITAHTFSNVSNCIVTNSAWYYFLLIKLQTLDVLFYLFNHDHSIQEKISHLSNVEALRHWPSSARIQCNLRTPCSSMQAFNREIPPYGLNQFIIVKVQ